MWSMSDSMPLRRSDALLEVFMGGHRPPTVPRLLLFLRNDRPTFCVNFFEDQGGETWP